MRKPISYDEMRKKIEGNQALLQCHTERIAKHEMLLSAIKRNLPELRALLDKINDKWCYEDYVYRFYHHSSKVFFVQELTLEVVDTLKNLMPEQELDYLFIQIVTQGTGNTFDQQHNSIWPEVTRPMIEAFLHCKYFLEMVVHYGENLNEIPNPLPSGWASILTLYGIR